MFRGSAQQTPSALTSLSWWSKSPQNRSCSDAKCSCRLCWVWTYWAPALLTLPTSHHACELWSERSTWTAPPPEERNAPLLHSSQLHGHSQSDGQPTPRPSTSRFTPCSTSSCGTDGGPDPRQRGPNLPLHSGCQPRPGRPVPARADSYCPSTCRRIR